MGNPNSGLLIADFLSTGFLFATYAVTLLVAVPVACQCCFDLLRLLLMTRFSVYHRQVAAIGLQHYEPLYERIQPFPRLGPSVHTTHYCSHLHCVGHTDFQCCYLWRYTDHRKSSMESRGARLTVFRALQSTLSLSGRTAPNLKVACHIHILVTATFWILGPVEFPMRRQIVTNWDRSQLPPPVRMGKCYQQYSQPDARLRSVSYSS